MHVVTISPIYQVVYVIVPTVGTIGNVLIIYVTIRSKNLRSTCNILIALISASDIMQMFGLYVMMVTYYAIPSHTMSQAVCACWQLIPTCGILLSTIWILNLALDRLMSLQRIYTMLVQNYPMTYIGMHAIPAVIITMGFGVWMFIERDEKEYILCEITAPQNGVIYLVITKFVIAVNVLIILCYALFLYFMRKATSNNDKMKNIYRSLIVTSLTVVVSWFTGTLVGVLAPVVDHDVTRADADLLAGLFANIPAVANIFIYYFISRDYRLVFQKYLFLCCQKKAGALQVKPGGKLAQKSTATQSTAGK